MARKAGDRVPEVETLTVLVEGRKATVSIDEIFGGMRVVLFAVPGAFTPTCSTKHLPGFVEHAQAIYAKGVDRIICLAPNDAYVMAAWANDQNVGDTVLMLADGSGDFTREMGLEKDGRAGGMGVRTQRYAMIVDDGVITDLCIEEPGQFGVSSAPAVLQRLSS